MYRGGDEGKTPNRKPSEGFSLKQKDPHKPKEKVESFSLSAEIFLNFFFVNKILGYWDVMTNLIHNKLPILTFISLHVYHVYKLCFLNNGFCIKLSSKHHIPYDCLTPTTELPQEHTIRVIILLIAPKCS